MAVRHRWIAGLAREDAGGVSRHLVDRFAIRVQGGVASGEERRSLLERRLARGAAAAAAAGFSRPSVISKELAPSVRVRGAAIDRALALAESVQEDEGIRAPLTLLRVAEALARLDGKGQVDVRGVQGAAAVLGFAAGDMRHEGSHGDDLHEESGEAPAAASDSVPGVSESDDAGGQRLVVVAESGESVEEESSSREARAGDALVAPDEESETVQAPAEGVPYETPAQPREYASLRLPWRQSQVASGGRGHIIGTRRADAIKDLAVFETLLAAAPYQLLRQAKLGGRRRRKSQHIVLRRSDLRSYRRAPPAGELLVLVLDYTSVAGREWLGALVPFLAEAYAARAELCVVRVGARSAQNPLRADRLLARNILVPSVAAALDEPAGRATPLADGLSLALRTIQQTLGHGRSSTRRATLIVVTDGRGNVPLEASREGHLRGRVGREGIEDAKRVARELRALAHVRRVLIDPEPELMQELPRTLARALDAERVPMERRDGW